MQVEEFFFHLHGEQKAIALGLHDLLTDKYALVPKLRYKLPFYYRKSWICYINPQNNGSVELAFTRGNELPNSSGILEAKGRKQVMSCTLKHVDDERWASIEESIHEAISLDEDVKYQSKRAK